MTGFHRCKKRWIKSVIHASNFQFSQPIFFSVGLLAPVAGNKNIAGTNPVSV
jgi:hypothetical protein